MVEMTGANLAFVCLMGIGTVFFGLICIIVLVWLTGKICSIFSKPQTASQGNGEVSSVKSASQSKAIENKQEIVAGVCAAIAEELGEDVSNIKVTSFKKL